MSPEQFTQFLRLAEWLAAAMGACTVTVVGAAVWVAVLVFKVGRKYGAVEKELEALKLATTRLDRNNERLEQLPVLVTKVEQLVRFVQRFSAAWPELKSRVDRLWEKVFSLNQWRRGSQTFGK